MVIKLCPTGSVLGKRYLEKAVRTEEKLDDIGAQLGTIPKKISLLEH
jgi:hypothetical protein